MDEDVLVPVRVDGVYGFADLEGRLRIAPQFEEALPFVGGAACVYRNGLAGAVRPDGSWALPCRFDLLEPDVDDVSGELWSACVEEGYGVISARTGEWVVPAVYEEPVEFACGLAGVMRDGAYGFIDRRNGVAVDFRYAQVGEFDACGLVDVEDERGVASFIDCAGRCVLRPEFEEVEGFREGWCVVGQGEKYGFMDPQGRLIGGLAYDSVEPVSDSVFAVWSRTPKEGIHELAEFLSNRFFRQHGDVLPEEDGTWRYVNRFTGRVIADGFRFVSGFEGGLASASREYIGGWEVIDRRGVSVVPCQFDEGPEFLRFRDGVIVCGDREGKREWYRSVRGRGGEVVFEQVKALAPFANGWSDISSARPDSVSAGWKSGY